MRLEEAYLDGRPDVVLVEGDTNTVLAGALAGAKLGIKVGHVEAGLRSYDRRMPEEHNRRLTDHASDLLFAPTEHNAATLRREDVWGKIFVTGNTVIDACLEYLPLAERRSSILERINFDEFALATAHRAENVDDPKVLANIAGILMGSPLPVVYPVHPRTTKRLRDMGLYDRLVSHDNVQLIDPVGYFGFLLLMSRSSFIMTDSGGIQEEATAPNIRKKVFVLRENTERPEAVEAGYADVVGTNPGRVLEAIGAYLRHPENKFGPGPFGDGRSGLRILACLFP
jgi:UDP-N-acetylglucosamine 2-epimerase (non-hydrolysing)